MTFANPHDAADAVCSALGLDASKVAALTITLTPNRLAEVAVVQYLEQPDADGLAAVLRHYDLTEQVDAPMDDDDEDLIDTARAYHDLRDAVLALHTVVPLTDPCDHGDRDACDAFETSDGEWVCGPVVAHACEACRDESGELVDWPCATAQAVESVGGAR